MLERRDFEIDSIRVPVKRRKTLDPEKAAALAESILEEGQKTPISVRADGDGFILVEGCTGWRPAGLWARRRSSGRWCGRSCGDFAGSPTILTRRSPRRRR
jgi:hypothetical protein